MSFSFHDISYGLAVETNPQIAAVFITYNLLMGDRLGYGTVGGRLLL